MIATLAVTLIIRELVSLAWEAWSSRHRPGVFPRSYRDACGPACRIKGMSDKGWRVRTQEAVQRAAERVHRAVAFRA